MEGSNNFNNGERAKIIESIASLKAEVHTHVFKQLDVLTDAVNDLDKNQDEKFAQILGRLTVVETKVDERTTTKRANTALWVAVISGLFALGSAALGLFGG